MNLDPNGVESIEEESRMVVTKLGWSLGKEEKEKLTKGYKVSIKQEE
jgi:hypothetical protein